MKCACKDLKREERIQGMLVEVCPCCGLITKKNLISFSEERKRYDAHICDEGYKSYMESLFIKIKPYIKGTNLDYGCGQIHYLADVLTANGISSNYYDLHYYPKLPDMTFDTIILVEVFEHLKDPYSELLKLKKSLLNPKGRIIIVTKPYDDVDLNSWWYFRDTTHISFIKKDSIQHWNLDMQILDQKGDIFVLECI
ncbi:MAG: class I SAM-dependent methyltransferase [Anaeroplasmataceae bacterium]|nr:class I SAM-dependent methyltransferase [Anaeroplasmataceae bacterium]